MSLYTNSIFNHYVLSSTIFTSSM